MPNVTVYHKEWKIIGRVVGGDFTDLTLGWLSDNELALPCASVECGSEVTLTSWCLLIRAPLGREGGGADSAP